MFIALCIVSFLLVSAITVNVLQFKENENMSIRIFSEHARNNPVPERVDWGRDNKNLQYRHGIFGVDTLNEFQRAVIPQMPEETSQRYLSQLIRECEASNNPKIKDIIKKVYKFKKVMNES